MKNLLFFCSICLMSLAGLSQSNPLVIGYNSPLGKIAIGQTATVVLEFGSNGDVIPANTVEWSMFFPPIVSVLDAKTMPSPFYEFSRTITASGTTIIIRNSPSIPFHTTENPQDGYLLVYNVKGVAAGNANYTTDDYVLPGSNVANNFTGDDHAQQPIIVVGGVSVSGNVWNDLNADKNINGTETKINGTNSGTGISTGVPMYVNLADVTGNIIASATVQADGSYIIPAVLPNQTGFQLQISSTQGVIGSLLPAVTIPAGWINTGVNADPSNSAIQNPATPELIILNTGISDLTNQNFGIEQTPESAVSKVQAPSNPGGTLNYPIPSVNWTTSTNPASNSNTLDYNGGTVDSIHVPTFPANITSITINNITYYPQGVTPPASTILKPTANFPIGGVTFPAPGGVPTTPVTIDPMDNIVNVVISFQAVDNGGIFDPTPGSITVSFPSVLPVMLTDFTATKIGLKAELTWITSSELNTSLFEVQRSSNGSNYVVIGKTAAAGNSNISKKYAFTDANPLSGVNYYRLRMVDIDGKYTYSVVRLLNFDESISIKIFPNPVVNTLYISGLAIGSTYNLTATNGQIVLQNKCSSSVETVTVSNLTGGTYFISIINKDKTVYTSKFVKK